MSWINPVTGRTTDMQNNYELTKSLKVSLKKNVEIELILQDPNMIYKRIFSGTQKQSTKTKYPV